MGLPLLKNITGVGMPEDNAARSHVNRQLPEKPEAKKSAGQARRFFSGE